MKAKKKWNQKFKFRVKSGDYHEKNIKIKFNSDDKLPLNKTLEFSTTIFLKQISVYNIKMKSKNEVKETDIENCAC